MKIAVGLPLAALGIALVRASMFAPLIAPEHSFSAAFGVFAASLFVPAVATGGILVTTLLSSRFSARLIETAVLFLVGVFLLDTIVMLEINEHPTLSGIVEAASAAGAVAPFVRFAHGVAFLLVAFSPFLRVELPKPGLRRFALTASICVLCAFAAPSYTKSVRYSLTTQYGFGANAAAGFFSWRREIPATLYPEPLAATLTEEFHRTRIPELPEDTPNIIVLTVESLSAVDSKRSGGTRDRLTALDEISSEGTLFTNSVSNYGDTEGGLIALIMGLPPIPGPRMTRRLYEDFVLPDSAAVAFKQRGYHTEFLTNGPLEFLGKGRFMNKIGFDTVSGLSEVPRFANAPKFTFLSPADSVLYDEALERIDRLAAANKRFFLSMLTVSTHPPYIDPEGIANTDTRILQYVSAQAAGFYRKLKERGFFENGILLIVGDHRKMSPVSEQEFALWGDSAPDRTFLAAFGKGVTPGRIDSRAVAHSDLVYRLDRLRSERPYSPRIYVAERYSMLMSPKNMGVFKVFEEAVGLAKAARGRVRDTTITWNERPPNADLIEQELHSLRAALQTASTGMRRTCNLVRSPGKLVPSGRNGVLVEEYSGTDIDGALAPDSPRFKRTFTASNIRFNDMLKLTDARKDFSMNFRSFLFVERRGDYVFRIESDDGVCMSVDGKVIIGENHRSLSTEWKEGGIALEPGMHEIELRYFQAGGGAALRVSRWNREFASLEPIPDREFFLPVEAGAIQ